MTISRYVVPVLLPLAVGAQAPIVVHPLGPVVATAKEPFSILTFGQAIGLADGRVFVAEAGKRILWQLDANLAKPVAILDSTRGRLTTFSTGSYIMTFPGDSVLFYDRAAAALVVIDPAGRLVRTMAAPPSGQGARVSAITSTAAPTVPGFSDAYNPPATSSSLGLVYRVRATGPSLRVSAGDPARPQEAMHIVRMDLATRKIDTVVTMDAGRWTARLGSGTGTVVSVSISSSGPLGAVTTRPNLYPFFDDAVVTSDGSIALFHAREYRIEWVNPDGSRTNSRLNYAWRRNSDDEKQRLVDSMNAAGRHRYDSVVAKRAADSARTGAPPMSTITGRGADGITTTRQAPSRGPSPPVVYQPDDIPDFYPPTAGAGSVMADADNNVWIRTQPAKPDTSGAAWEIINRKGQLVDRVWIPRAIQIIGFAPGGFALVARRDAGLYLLEKTRVR